MQTGWVNQSLEQYLYCFTNDHQDSWITLLPALKFAYNNTPHVTTKWSLFVASLVYVLVSIQSYISILGSTRH